MVKQNITVLLKQECDDFCIEYGWILIDSVITNSDDAIDDVWNVFNIQKGPDRKRGKLLNNFIYENDRR